MTFLRRLWGLLTPHKKLFYSIVALIVLSEMVALLGPYIFKLILDNLIVFNKEGFRALILFSVLLLAVYQLGAYLNFTKDIWIFKYVAKVEEYLPRVANEKLMSLSLRYHEDKNTGTMITKIQRGTDKLVNLVSESLWEFIPTAIQTLLTFGFMIILDIRIALVFVWVVPVFIILTLLAEKRNATIREEIHDKFEEAAGRMSESIRNILTVQSYAQEPRELDSHKRVLGYLYWAQRQRFGSFMRFNLMRMTVIDIGRFFLMILGIFWVTSGEVTPGTLVLFLTLSEKAYFSLFRLSRIYNQIVDSAEVVSRITDLLEEHSEIQLPKRPKRITTMKGDIIFDRVVFSYEKEKPVLDAVSFHAPAGQTVALVGPSGSGKSTIVRMIYRHQDPICGKICVDSHDLRSLDLSWYRSRMSIVTQDIDIFDRSVRENIAYGNPRATKQQIEAAAGLANANEFIQYLPDGYDTVVGERGIKLSGGQKQRVGIARALLVEPKILILDEATSSLDSKSERLIQESLERIMKEGRMTIIVIAHRLSTTKLTHFAL